MPSDDEATRLTGLAMVFDQHRRELLRFLTARCGDPTEAEDHLQDLWIKVSRPQAGPIADGRAYLFRMANNVVLDARKMRQRAMARDRKWLAFEGGGELPPEERRDAAIPPDEALVQEQEAQVLRAAIAELPPGAREALRLFRFEGKSQGEIAEIMGISRSGVEKHLALAMRRLRDALSNCGFFEAATSGEQGASRSIDSSKGRQA